MKFSGALNALIAGVAITREAWPADFRILLPDDGDGTEIQGWRGNNGAPWEVKHADLLANDWLIYEDRAAEIARAELPCPEYGDERHRFEYHADLDADLCRCGVEKRPGPRAVTRRA